MSNDDNYVIKKIRLHKKYDKKIIDMLNSFSQKRQLSYKVKEILSEYFDGNNETMKMLKEIKRKLETGNISSIRESIESLEKYTETKNISELMGDMYDESDEEELW
jgi:hypothetical protein